MKTLTKLATAVSFLPVVATDNVWSLMNEICDRSKTNMIRFDYAGKAIASGTAAVRAASGATKDSETVFQAGDFTVKTASKANNVYLYTDRAMRTEKETDGSFDHRSYRIASIDEVTIPVILVNRNFKKGWEAIEINKLSVFPLLDRDEDKNKLGELLHLRADLENLKDHLDKNKNRLMAKHGKALKAGNVAKNAAGLSVRYVAPTGFSTRMVDNEGNAIKQESFTRTDGAKLVPETGSVAFSPLPSISDDFNELPTIHKMSKDANDALSALNAVIRPYELGVIEHADADLAVLNGEIFSIVLFEYKDYDYSAVTKALLKAGEYKAEKVAKSKGENLLEEAK